MTDYKQIIIVRKELKMTCGKIAAQVAHGSLRAALIAKRGVPSVFDDWMEAGGKKIVLKTGSLGELNGLFEWAAGRGLPHAKVIDQGRTQIPAGTFTALCIGPADSELLDERCSELKLL